MGSNLFLMISCCRALEGVTDGEVEECVDPGGNGAIMNVGEVGDPARQEGREMYSWHWTVEEVRRSRCWKA